MSWSKDSSASRCASTPAKFGANCPDATASISARAITPSTVIRERISGQSKALRRGFGSAKPEVSIKICSGLGLSSIRASIVGIKSSATVQQMQPFASSIMFSAGQSGIAQLFNISPSTPTSPNSLTITANLLPFGLRIN